jgi:hypothetical protein
VKKNNILEEENFKLKQKVEMNGAGKNKIDKSAICTPLQMKENYDSKVMIKDMKCSSFVDSDLRYSMDEPSILNRIPSITERNSEYLMVS